LRINGAASSRPRSPRSAARESQSDEHPGVRHRQPTTATRPSSTTCRFHGIIDQVRIHNSFLIPGDANYDGGVNLADFNVLATNFGQEQREWTQGDSYRRHLNQPGRLQRAGDTTSGSAP
jgi:hypothetical protein